MGKYFEGYRLMINVLDNYSFKEKHIVYAYLLTEPAGL